MRLCCICLTKRDEKLYQLPSSLEDLGYHGMEWAHPQCVTATRSLFAKMAAKRGVSLEQLVASQAR